MVEINLANQENAEGKRFWKGVSHHVTIVKSCCSYMLSEFTDDIDMAEHTIKDRQGAGVDKETQAQNLKKKRYD